MDYRNLVLGLMVFLVAKTNFAADITTLPGYDGNLPFKLETGYVGVGTEDAVQFFYYFVQSQSKPTEDPILLWITGAPGCSSLIAFFFENGPLEFDYENYNGEGIPKLALNPSAWTQRLNMIFLDGPVGTGFTYSKTQEGFYSSDTTFAKHIHQFLQKWVKEHPNFGQNGIYIGGDGYSGVPIPIAIQNILDGNEAAGDATLVNIEGFVLGNPGTNFSTDFNARTTFAHRLGLLPDHLYQEANNICEGNFINPPNKACELLMDYINNKILGNINGVQILEPACNDRTFTIETTRQYFLNVSKGLNPKWCRKYLQLLSDIWANDEEVQKALHVEIGTKTSWESCNDTINDSSYNHSMSDVVGFYRNFTKTNLQGLIYNGDHDMEISYIATLKWIYSLNLLVTLDWTPWSLFDDADTVGYTMKFQSQNFNLAYATIKAGGHFALEYKPKEGYQMMDRWVTNGTIPLSSTKFESQLDHHRSSS